MCNVVHVLIIASTGVHLLSVSSPEPIISRLHEYCYLGEKVSKLIFAYLQFLKVSKLNIFNENRPIIIILYCKFQK